jgi:hypothetical protein
LILYFVKKRISLFGSKIRPSAPSTILSDVEADGETEMIEAVEGLSIGTLTRAGVDPREIFPLLAMIR